MYYSYSYQIGCHSSQDKLKCRQFVKLEFVHVFAVLKVCLFVYICLFICFVLSFKHKASFLKGGGGYRLIQKTLTNKRKFRNHKNHYFFISKLKKNVCCEIKQAPPPLPRCFVHVTGLTYHLRANIPVHVAL